MIHVSAARRRRLVLALVGCLAAVSSGLVVEGASGANTAPVAIVIDSITGQDLTELGDLPPGAAPLTFVKVDQTFTVDVSFEDSAGAAVPFNSDTVLEITGRELTVRPLEAIDGTPVVDIKPVLGRSTGSPRRK